VNSGAVTKATDEDWEAVLANENLARAIAQETEHRTAFRDDGVGRSVPLSTSAPSLSLDSVPPPVAPAIHSQAWQSQSSAKRRQILMLTTIALTGSVLAIICFISFVRWAGQTPELSNATETDKPVVPNENLPDTSPPGDSQPPLPSAVGAKPNEFQAIEPSEVIENGPPTPTQPQNDSNPTTSNAPGNDTSIGPATTPTLTPPAPANANAPKANATDSSSDLDLADVFPQDFLGGLLNPNKKQDVAFGREQAKDDLNIETATVDVRNAYHPPARTVPNWSERSKLKIPSFKLNQVSLLRCIDWFSRATGVGITVDWQSCRIAGIDLSKQVSMSAQGKTVEELVDTLAKENGLVFQLDKQGLPVLRASQEAMEKRLPSEWSIEGLLPASTEQEIGSLLLEMSQCGDICSLQNGRLQWTEAATTLVKANVLSTLYEFGKLNRVPLPMLATDGKPPIPLFTPALWHGGASKLNTKVGKSAVIPEPRPIPDLLMITAAETKLDLIIDWQNAWGHGLVPDESAVSFLPGRTPSQIAQRFLSNYALELVPISESSFSLTTGDVRRKLTRVVPLRIPKNMKSADLKQSLFLLAPLGADDRNAFLFKEVPGMDDLVLVRICAPRADQLNDPNLIQSFGWE
jgi:hypothetical protein